MKRTATSPNTEHQQNPHKTMHKTLKNCRAHTTVRRLQPGRAGVRATHHGGHARTPDHSYIAKLASAAAAVATITAIFSTTA